VKKKYEKHLAYYELRDELRKSAHCAFCSLERKATHKFFDGLLYEKVTDRDMRAALVRSQGFCPRHSHVLAGFGDGLGTAILYQDQIQLRLKALEKSGAKPRGSRNPSASSAKGGDGCPACRRVEQVRSGLAHTLLQSLSDPEMVEVFTSSSALCFPHFSLVLNEAKESVARSVLLRIESERLEQLLALLKRYIAKHDYRRTAEGFAEEKESWTRAVEIVSGVKNVF